MTQGAARPVAGTIKSIAECTCGEMIERTKISNGWYHSSTGEVACGTEW